MLSKRNLAIILFVLVFFTGCVENFDDYLDSEKAGNYTLNVTVTRVSGNCYCFVCKNGTEEIIWPFSLLYDETLEEGSCSFLSSCNETTLNDSKEDQFFPKPFMLGMGPRTWDFTYANTYCNNSLGFVVHWLPSDGEEYTLPAKSEAECFLGKQVIPVYVLYSNSTAVDIDSAGTLAGTMNGVGPVILVAEIDFDSSNETVVANVKAQIQRMRYLCPHPPGFEFGVPENDPYCLIAVAPKMGDYSGLDKILRDSNGNIDITMNNSIDLVAVGVNSHYLNSSECKAETLYYEAIEFSKYAWFNYSKPVIWPYMLFDSSGGNLHGTCLWSQYEVNEAYHEFFEGSGAAMPAAIAAGVIGAAPYQFYGLGYPTDPLDCENCGLIQIAEGKLAAKEPLFSSWFYGCQQYSPKHNYILAAFSEKLGGTCNIGFMGGLFALTKITTETPSGYYIAPDDPEEMLFSCMTCIDECEDDEGEECEFNPYDIPEGGYTCEGFVELDLWGSIRGLDPAFVRAIALSESGLNEDNPATPENDSAYCEVSYAVNIGANCNPLNVLEVKDPSGVCQDYIHKKYLNEIEDMTVKTANEYYGSELVSGDASDKVKPCAYGLMQIASGYPWMYWYDVYTEVVVDPKTEKSANEVLSAEFISAMESCAEDGEFNPFEGNDNACMGTWILKSKWDSAEGWVNSHASELSADTKIKKKWITAFIASYYYAGLPAVGGTPATTHWLNNFKDRKDATTDDLCAELDDMDTEDVCCDGSQAKESPCCNSDNFITFVSCCMQYNPGYDYKGRCDGIDDEEREGLDYTDRSTGFRRLTLYYGIIENCEYGCSQPDLLLGNIQAFIDSHSD